ncbi:tetrathionate reductase subunit B [Geomonas limicola]|uniref:Tetrathionate reductase subunit B n=1 Tax=Geomonas limicola TaxID=2740186 RepID=A0A6V8N7X7_9BACT|nr:4Fe-4S dicluster domain-containing protein [Geomonas limicola]GFO68682.1 tetrathionate reductase subunit B [Geomonas limicola]
MTSTEGTPSLPQDDLHPESVTQHTSRRAFLTQTVLGILAAGSARSAGAAEKVAEQRWRMIIDLNRCTGCQSCVIACKAQNDTAPQQFNTRILIEESKDTHGSRVAFTPVQCNQCENPPCVPSCAPNATFKLPNGIVVTDWERCSATLSCISACPYEARYPDPRHGNKVDKCDFCLHRLVKGLNPACVDACPSRARLFGNALAPEGEFAQYLSRNDLVSRKPELGITTSLLYVPLRARSGRTA